uniref:2-Hacid_dh domain-containing protein n=1 Tax=Globodera pallida TaxID=36090 RepID=A0A183BS94_GLOPA
MPWGEMNNNGLEMTWLRQHPRVLSLPWRANVRRSEKANVVDAIVAGVRLSVLGEEDAAADAESTEHRRQWNNFFAESVPSFSAKERREWLTSLDGVCVASESPFNSRDNIDLAKQFGAKFVVTPRGGANDEEICVACEERSIVLIHTANTQTMR